MRRAVPILPAILLLAAPACVGLPGGYEWVVIAFIALLLFGGSKLPGLMRSMGAGINEFKKGLKEGGEPDSLAGGEPGEKPKEIETGSGQEKEKAGGS